MRIAADVLVKAHEQSVPCDEILIASSDSDFTPILHALRARGLRTGILCANDPAPAYANAADLYLGPEALLSMISRGLLKDDSENPSDVARPGSAPSGTVLAHRAQAGGPDLDKARRDTATLIRELLGQSSGPVLLSHLGNQLHKRFAGVIERSNWFGSGGLSAFIRNTLAPELAARGYHAWDPTRHTPPPQAQPVTPASERDGGLVIARA